MSARSFRSVFMAGAIASAALGCYLVSLRVASERAELEGVENKIVLAQRDIRMLDTEIGTRGRLAQLERWNVKVIRLSAPTADQFVEGAFQLATLAKPDAKPVIDAPVVLASAHLPDARPQVVTDGDADMPAPRASRPLGEMMHVASYSAPEPRAPSIAAQRPAAPKALPVPKASVAAISVKGAAPVKSGALAKALAPRTAATKPIKTAMADPLKPLPAIPPKAKSDPSGSAPRAAAKHASKDPGSH